MLQELDVNASPLLQSTTENSAAENSVPAISLPPLVDDSHGTLLEDAELLQRSSRTQRTHSNLTTSFKLSFSFFFLFSAWSKAYTGLILLETSF